MRNFLTVMLLTVFASAVLSSKPAWASCAEGDLPCLRLRLLNAEEDNDRLKLQLEGMDKLFKISEEQLRILTEQNTALGKAAQAALASAQSVLPKWYEHPMFWGSIGLVLGVILTVTVGVVVSRAWPPSQPAP
jgi:hypothetical protein